MITGLTKTDIKVKAPNRTASNVDIVDAIGNKEDTYASNSLHSKTDLLVKHLHNKAEVYPNNCIPITLTTSATPNTHGTIVEIVPASTINDVFDIHWVTLSDISANGNYELRLYTGASGSEVELTNKSFFRNSNFIQEGNLSAMSDSILPGTRISASIKGSNAAANTCAIRLEYHTY